MRSKVFSDRVCVVTGAGGGIGREIARLLAESGAHLAVSDINSEGLEETATLISKSGAWVHAQHLDVTDDKAVFKYADTVKEEFGRVDQLYNNAGISGGGKTILDTSVENFQRVLDINLAGVLNGCRVFMPELLASENGKLVNISSLNGLMAMPHIAAYCTSKFAVRGLTEAIRADALQAGQKLHVVCVHPGGVKTNIASSNRQMLNEIPEEQRQEYIDRIELYEQRFLTYPTEKAAADILRGIARKKNRIVVTGHAKFLDILSRLFPSGYLPLMNWMMKHLLK